MPGAIPYYYASLGSQAFFNMLRVIVRVVCAGEGNIWPEMKHHVRVDVEIG